MSARDWDSHIDDGSDSRNIVEMQVPGYELGSFLAGLLGDRRTIIKTFDCKFEIDHNWIVNIIELIEQRIFSQNNAKLINLEANIYYKNGKVVQLSGMEQLKSYLDVSRDISVAIDISCAYIIKFPYRDTPETQEIGLQVITKDIPSSLIFSPSLIRKMLMPLDTDDDAINLKIRHTDVSWAEDFTNLISNHIDSAFPRRSIVSDKIRIFLYIMMPVIACFSLVSSMSIVEGFTASTRLNFLKNFESLFINTQQPSINTINSKIDVLYKYAIFVETYKPRWLMAASLLVPVMVVVFGMSAARFRRRSYIIMNEATRQHVIIKKKRNKLVFSIVVLGFFLSLIVGVFGNAIYARLPEL